MKNLESGKESKSKDYKVINFRNCRSTQEQEEIEKLLEEGHRIFLMMPSKKLLELKQADL